MAVSSPDLVEIAAAIHMCIDPAGAKSGRSKGLVFSALRS